MSIHQVLIQTTKVAGYSYTILAMAGISYSFVLKRTSEGGWLATLFPPPPPTHPSDQSPIHGGTVIFVPTFQTRVERDGFQTFEDYW